MIPHIVYDADVLRLLDQRRIPDAVEYVELRDWQSVAQAIAAMVVRGAPAIGISGAYGVALAARAAANGPHFLDEVSRAAHGLASARPTAVNLSWAVTRLLREALDLVDAEQPPHAIAAALERSARAIHEDDIESCKRIGDAGAALIPAGATVLTHCNTGGLATGGYGTALGVIRSAHRDGKIARVLVGETRPQLQGARLTVWELLGDGIPHTLITDSMAASFMRRGAVSAVVVGADRIARNGDVANKIGTYGLAVLASAHRVPFIVAAPLSSFDPARETGDSIPIEQRDPAEVTHVAGVRVAPAEAVAANPAFDVTPASLVTAIATDRGLLRPPLDRAISGVLDEAPVSSAT
jgi:methylthioribose-1-phosphate isomerase